MKNIFLLALATALTVGQAVHATDKSKHAKQTCKDCKEKVCTPRLPGPLWSGLLCKSSLIPMPPAGPGAYK